MDKHKDKRQREGKRKKQRNKDGEKGQYKQICIIYYRNTSKMSQRTAGH